jgi:hypothetical protein
MKSVVQSPHTGDQTRTKVGIMEKRYQVFVSSTYEDLREERAEVIQALLELDCMPSGMELFPAGDDEQWTVIKRVIDDCDYYIVVIGGRYGSVGTDGKSYTQREYEYAVSKGKPVMAFLHENPGDIPQSKSEQDPARRQALEQFLDLAKKKICKFWNSPKELAGMFSRGLAKMKQERPAVGWVRADAVPDEGAAREMLRIRNENDELQRLLQQHRAEPPKGSEVFAQGNERISLTFTYELGNQSVREPYVTTWNELFALLGPLMIDGASERDLKKKLFEGFTNRKYDKQKLITYQGHIRDEDFQKIKIQFRALGLIAKDDRSRVARDSNTLWILTPYGDTLMTQVAAVRSSPSSA